jgi:hypothetical protein
MEEHVVADDLTRYATNLRFRYRRATEATALRQGGRLRDLNARGAWVELPERLATRTDLALALDTPDGELPLGARVAWTHPGLRAAPYLHGVRFTTVTPERRQRLRALLAEDQPRPAVRLYCRLAASCQRTGVACPAVASSIRDLSASGVGLRLPEPLAPGTEVWIRTATLYGRIAAAAQVVWADPPARLPPGAAYRHGLRFLRLDPLSELPLHALLQGVR